MDNGGENLKLQKRMASADWKIPIKVEFTARNTPQQNSPAETSFTTITGRAKALLINAKVPLADRFKLFPYTAQTATKLDGLSVVTINGVTATRHKHQLGFEPGWTKYLHTWGEAGTVCLKARKHPKVVDKGQTMMFVGYPDDHPADTFNMWDPATKRTHKSRDVIFLKRLFFESSDIQAGKGNNANPFSPLSLDESDDEVAEDDDAESVESVETVVTSVSAGSVESIQGQAAQVYVAAPTGVTRAGRRVQPITRLTYAKKGQQMEVQQPSIGLTNAELAYYAVAQQFAESFGQEVCLVGAGLGGGFVNTMELHPMKFNEAMAGPDAAEWEKAVDKEHDRMVNAHVFKVTPLKDVPKNAIILTETWAMKKKSNGTFRARLTARGFEQVDGIHFDSSDIAAPVVSEITIHVVLILWA
ncbi:MAG: hypothetical protein ACRCT2_05465, partial [Plesiomonas shigelloides]